MFYRKKRQQKLMENIGMIKPTSKASLKQQCLYLSNLNVEKAEKMYDFLMKGMDGIPDVEPTTKPFIQNFGEQANKMFGWLRENKDMLSDGADFIRGIVAKKTPTPLPPIND